MKFPKPAIISGNVVHKRLFPVSHRLNYGLFFLLIDLDDLAEMQRRSLLFSHNRWNLLSFHDKDMADGEHGDLAQYARDLVRERIGLDNVGKVLLLSCPRFLGHVFNPLSVCFCLDSDDAICAAIYEVSNTFGGRKTYVCGVEHTKGKLNVEQAAKELLVSPFNKTSGKYSFAIDHDEEDLTIGVALREDGKPVLTTWFTGRRLEMTTPAIVSLALKRPFQSLQVLTAIHYQAAKLWLKGLRPPKGQKVTKRQKSNLDTPEVRGKNKTGKDREFAVTTTGLSKSGG